MSISAGVSVGGGLDAVGDAAGAANMVAGAAIGVASLAGARVPAMLRCTELPHIGFVPFDFNPTTIAMRRTSQGSDVPSGGGEAGAVAGSDISGGTDNVTHTVQPSQITISGIIFEGPTAKLRCDTLLTWMSPQHGFFALIMPKKKTFKTAPSKLTFQWGPPMVGFMYDVQLTSCSINYTRFTAAGIPIRASVDLTMKEVPSLLGSLPTNPTSGGLPGRRRHTVGDGESLQSIATARYGRPGLWRRIAEVNGITDPSRLRPGTTIYLPNRDELTAAGAR